MLGDQRVPAIGADEELRAHGEVLAGQTVATGRRHTVRVLDMADIFGAHAGLRAARAGRLEQNRLHEGLGQVVHEGGRRQQMLGLGERVRAQLFMRPISSPARLSQKTFSPMIVLRRGMHHGFRLDVGAEVAQHFHGALVGDVRARRVRQPAVAVDHHVRHAIARQQRRRGRAGGPVPTISTSVSISAIRFLPRCSVRSACGEPEIDLCRCGPRSVPRCPLVRTASRRSRSRQASSGTNCHSRQEPNAAQRRPGRRRSALRWCRCRR